MKQIIRQIPLYRFLMFCNESDLDKTVLDCGAGGNCPPLSLFSDYGYLTHGIEFSQNQLDTANKFAAENNQTLNIELGDMRNIKFDDESFSFVYSYNSVFHMSKEDVKKSVNELKRVLKKGGLLFVNFLTVNDFRCGTGVSHGNNQYDQMDDHVPVIHSYFEINEADEFFKDMQLVYKEDRTLERIYDGQLIKQGYVDYILKK